MTHENVVANSSAFLKSIEVSSQVPVSVTLIRVSGLSKTLVFSNHMFLFPQLTTPCQTWDCSLSYLPLAHMFERVVQVNTFLVLLTVYTTPLVLSNNLNTYIA